MTDAKFNHIGRVAKSVKTQTLTLLGCEVTDGEVSERVAARELDLQSAFAIAVLQALGAVVFDMKDIDLYFDDIRNGREQPPAEKQ
jgi:hypothetical protein